MWQARYMPQGTLSTPSCARGRLFGHAGRHMHMSNRLKDHVTVISYLCTVVYHDALSLTLALSGLASSLSDHHRLPCRLMFVRRAILDKTVIELWKSLDASSQATLDHLSIPDHPNRPPPAAPSPKYRRSTLPFQLSACSMRQRNPKTNGRGAQQTACYKAS